MDRQPLYLRPNVKLEPLFNQWYAWSQLLAPATAAMNVANHHIKLMKSYVAAPMAHATALKNPSMVGGRFVNLGGGRVAEVKALLERTLAEQGHLIEFAGAVAELNRLLASEGRGQSLEPLYPKIPALLRGYVELGYDLRHQASARFIEPLLYRSRFHDRSRQSVALGLITQHERPLILSTPWLENPDEVHLPLSFDDERLDALCRMKRTPAPLGAVRELLGLDDDVMNRFRRFLTLEPPVIRSSPAAGPRVRYFGHACLLVETQDVAILTDPAIGYEYPSTIARYTFEDLPERIDHVLITHAHHDHLMLETLLPLRERIGQIVVPRANGTLADPSLDRMLRMAGFPRVVALDELDSFLVPGGRITGLPFFGEHGDLALGSKLAFLIELGGKRVVCAADSRNLEPRLYDLLREALGLAPLDALFLGMESEGAPMSWLYGPLMTERMSHDHDNGRRLNGSDSARALALLDSLPARAAYVYALGQEPWYSHIMGLGYSETSPQIRESNAFVAACRQRGLVSERLYGRAEILL